MNYQKKNNKKTVERIYGMSSSIMNYTYSQMFQVEENTLSIFQVKTQFFICLCLMVLRKEKSIEVSFNMIYTADEARKYKRI